MAGANPGPRERAWLLANNVLIEDDDLPCAELLWPDGGPPMALIPAWARGDFREACFAYCMTEVLLVRHGWLEMTRRLVDLSRVNQAA